MRSFVFAHVPKCCGSYVHTYINSKLIQGMGYEVVTHQDNENAYSDICDIAKCKTQTYFRTHILTPANYHLRFGHYERECAENAFRRLQENDWFVFSFVRNPADQLTSSYFFSRKMLFEKGRPRFEWVRNMSLNEYIEVVGHCAVEYPAYWREFDFVTEYSEENFAYFLKKYLGHDYEFDGSLYANKSENRGFCYYVDSGEISKENADRVLSHPNFQTFNDIKQQGIWESGRPIILKV